MSSICNTHPAKANGPFSNGSTDKIKIDSL